MAWPAACFSASQRKCSSRASRSRAGTSADWAEVRYAAIGNLILGVALTAVNIIFYPYFNHAHPTVRAYIIGVAALTVGMGFFYWRQERQQRRLAGMTGELRPVEGRQAA